MPALAPTPIGTGPRYHPRPALHAPCAAGPLAMGARVHLELFAGRRVVVVPAAIGLRGARLELGRVARARCRARLWTLDPTGVVGFAGPARLGDLFRVWGEPLGRVRLLSFSGPVRLYRNGSRVRGDPRLVRLRAGDELVLEIGGYVVPHRGYRFPRRLH